MTVNAKPIFLWDNKLVSQSGLTITHSTDESGFPFANILDWRKYLKWQSSDSGDLFIKIDAGSGETLILDSFAVAGHDLHTQGATIKLQYSDNDADWYDVVSVTPSTDRDLARFFTSAEHRYFKVLMPTGYVAPPKIGHLFLGEMMQMPVWTSGPFNPRPMKIVSEDSTSATGQHLETIEKYRWLEISVKFKGLSRTWCDANLDPFELEHMPAPFYWVWDKENHPNDVYLMKKKPGGKYDREMGPSLDDWSIVFMGVDG